jgi:hypothetical protein
MNTFREPERKKKKHNRKVLVFTLKTTNFVARGAFMAFVKRKRLFTDVFTDENRKSHNSH